MENRFSEIDITEGNILEIIRLVRDGWVGLEDEKAGGIVAVGKPESIAEIIKLLNGQ